MLEVVESYSSSLTSGQHNNVQDGREGDGVQREGGVGVQQGGQTGEAEEPHQVDGVEGDDLPEYRPRPTKPGVAEQYLR